MKSTLRMNKGRRLSGETPDGDGADAGRFDGGQGRRHAEGRRGDPPHRLEDRRGIGKAEPPEEVHILSFGNPFGGQDPLAYWNREEANAECKKHEGAVVYTVRFASYYDDPDDPFDGEGAPVTQIG